MGVLWPYAWAFLLAGAASAAAFVALYAAHRWWMAREDASYGACGRCGCHWNHCTGHTTWYERTEGGGTGCFALCESCWRSLTPRERLPYYDRLWHARMADAREDERERMEAIWPLLRAAVLAGK